MSAAYCNNGADVQGYCVLPSAAPLLLCCLLPAADGTAAAAPLSEPAPLAACCSLLSTASM